MGVGRGDVEEMERGCSLPVSFAGMWRENRTANRPADTLSDVETQRPSQFARLSCWCHSRGGVGGEGCHLQDGVPGTL